MEVLQHGHDVLALAFAPDGKHLASSTLDGQIYFWDALEGSLQVGLLADWQHGDLAFNSALITLFSVWQLAGRATGAPRVLRCTLLGFTWW